MRISRRARDIRPSGIRRFFDLLTKVTDIISFGVGEPDFTTPWCIREAGIKALEKGYTMYTSNKGLPELREEISRYLEDKYGISYDPENEILITVGVSEAFDLAIRALVDEEDEVLIQDPSYVSYRPCTILSGGKPVPVPLKEERDFSITAEDIEKKISSKTKVLILNYPHNPTGSTIYKEELLKIAELAERRDLIVISDEIYSRLIYEGEHISFPSLPGMKGRTVLLGGFSKAYAMTGWRIGFAAGPEEIIQAMLRIHQYTMLCAPIISQISALEALRNGEEEVSEMVEEYDRRRKLITQGLREIGLKCVEPKGAFYIFPSIKETGLSSEEFSERLLLEEKVLVVPGNAFGENGEGYVRICYALPREKIEEALPRIERFLKKL